MSDILDKVSDPKTVALIREYIDLTKLSELNEYQSKRYGEILFLAERNEDIDFLINETEHILGHKLGILDVELIKNSQSLLRERLGIDIPKFIDPCPTDSGCSLPAGSGSSK